MPSLALKCLKTSGDSVVQKYPQELEVVPAKSPWNIQAAAPCMDLSNPVPFNPATALPTPTVHFKPQSHVCLEAPRLLMSTHQSGVHGHINTST